MTGDREALRRRSDELAAAGDVESDEVVRVNRVLFEADPGDKEICNRLGIALHNRALDNRLELEEALEEASEVFKRGLDAEPKNDVGRGRLGKIEEILAGRPALTAAEVIEPAF